MTVSYNLDVASSSSLSWLRIIFRWRGSIWKSVLNELCTWTICYYIVFCIYRFALNDWQQIQFSLLAQHCDKKLDYIPLTFMLGFFVTVVVDRWKNIFANMGFVDNCAFFVSTYIRGMDEETKTIKRNIVRYLCLTQVLVLRDISIKVRKRFPNLEAVVDGGFLQPHEKEMMDKVSDDFTKYWMPINWVFSLVYDLRARGKISADVLMNGMLQEVRNYRTNLQTLCNYDWVPVPLAYPQVVFLAVRVYFLICLISRQYIITEDAANKSILDLYVPFMSMLQLVFYMGWLKVAEALLNPLGEDDDDFEGNYVIDRNITIAMTMVDQCSCESPMQLRDTFQEGEKPLYSEEAATMPVHALVGSASKVPLSEENRRVSMVPHVEEQGSPSLRRNSIIQGGQKLTKRIKSEFSRRLSRPSITSQDLEADSHFYQFKPGQNASNGGAHVNKDFVPDPPKQETKAPAQKHLDTVSEEDSPNGSIDEEHKTK